MTLWSAYDILRLYFFFIKVFFVLLSIYYQLYKRERKREREREKKREKKEYLIFSESFPVIAFDTF